MRLKVSEKVTEAGRKSKSLCKDWKGETSRRMGGSLPDREMGDVINAQIIWKEHSVGSFIRS